MMENPIKMDDLGVPLFTETPIYNLLFSKKTEPTPNRQPVLFDLLRQLHFQGEGLHSTHGESPAVTPRRLLAFFWAER